MHHLFLASRNAHKTRELAECSARSSALEDLRESSGNGDVIEDGATFAENARLKAMAVSRQVPGLVLADDSGLEVDSLGGAPGVYSARYAGAEGAADETNRQKVARGDGEAATGCGPSGALSLRSGPGAGWRSARDFRRFGGRANRQASGAARPALVTIRYSSLTRFEKTFAELPAADEKLHKSPCAAPSAKMKQFLTTARIC